LTVLNGCAPVPAPSCAVKVAMLPIWSTGSIQPGYWSPSSEFFASRTKIW
jgi:hypothetical protein